MNTPDKSWVLITGASSGFGEEFARQYAAQGHSLVLVARRLDRLQTLAERLRQQFRSEVVVEQVDLSDIAAVIQLHQRLRERGIEIDILINNAGHGLQGPFADAPLDAVLSMVQLDVTSLTAVTHVFAQDMRTRKRGKILLVASVLAYQGVENFAVYSAAKAYVLRLAEALHRELKRDERGRSNDNHHVRTETQIRQPVRPGACKPTGGFQPVLQIKFPRAARRYRMRHCPASQNSDGRLSRRCRSPARCPSRARIAGRYFAPGPAQPPPSTTRSLSP
jgi:NADP-dependent 3-hydroxy acid dehydrogenase YdfG